MKQNPSRVAALALSFFFLLQPAPAFFLDKRVTAESSFLQSGEGVISSTHRYSHLVDEFNREYPDIDGLGITAALFNSGSVFRHHVEFGHLSRPLKLIVKSREAPGELSTFLAGLMVARGVNPRAKGIAPRLSIINEDLKDPFNKLAALGPTVQVLNHPYAIAAGWDRDSQSGLWYWLGDIKQSEIEDSTFGKYGPEAATLDGFIYKFPQLLTFYPAGDQRDNGPDNQPVRHKVSNISPNGRRVWKDSDVKRNPDGFDSGLDTIAGFGLAKNTLCIGAINVSARLPITPEPYSSWGPADDGRIKPDLVANGHALMSASYANANANAYATQSGTRIASTVASGVGALMMQLLRRERPKLTYYSAAVIKAVLIHTATDDRAIPGPDARFGWGSINALEAGRVIASKDGQRFRHFIDVGDLAKEISVRRTYSFNSIGRPIRVTLVWIDPPGSENRAGLDEATPILQNNLDIILTAPNGKLYYPYRLDAKNRFSPARRDGPNRVDTVEVIDAPFIEGKWQIEVIAASIKQGPIQRFALVVSGLTQ